MAFNFGVFSEFSDSSTVHDPAVAAVAKTLELSPHKGAFFQAMTPPALPLKTKAFKVYTRQKTSRNGKIGATKWTAAAKQNLAMDAAALIGLTAGHVLQLGSEVVVVKSVNRTANTIDLFSRGAGGTKAAEHAANSTFKVIGFAGSDELLKDVESFNGVTDVYENYVQTVFETLDWNKHAELTRQGLSDANAVTVLLKEKELNVAEMLGSMAILGRKQKGSADGNNYMSAGLLHQLSDTENGSRTVLLKDAAGAAFTEELFRSAVKAVFKADGVCDTAIVSSEMSDWFNSFDSSVALTAPSDATTAGTFINAYNYNGHIIKIIVDADMPEDCFAAVKIGDCKKQWLDGDGLTLKDEPSKSSRESRKSLQGSIAFAIENVGKNHIFVKNVGAGTRKRVFNTKAV